jgi:molybdopterin/thiamine biosynthesis adenylyltransferase
MDWHMANTSPKKETAQADRFDYGRAFSRNLGIISPVEQERLRRAKVAIPGCGGVGSLHALTLARMGIGHFVLADFDTFEIENFNRQYGARQSTVGKHKAHSLKQDILDINPDAQIEIFEEGVNEKNIGQFLSGVEIVIDSLDFFAFSARDVLFPAAQRQGVPLVTGAPLGLSCALLVFTKNSMSYRDYFDFQPDDGKERRALKFMMGLAPRSTHSDYVNFEYVDFEQQRGPSSVIAVNLCAAMVCGEALKVLLARKNIRTTPNFSQFDTYRNRYTKGRLRAGNRGWLQRLKMWVVHRTLLRRAKT